MLLMYLRPDDQLYAVPAITGDVLSTFIAKNKTKNKKKLNIFFLLQSGVFYRIYCYMKFNA